MIFAFVRWVRISSAGLLWRWITRAVLAMHFKCIQEIIPLLTGKSIGNMDFFEIVWKTDFLVCVREKDYNPLAPKITND